MKARKFPKAIPDIRKVRITFYQNGERRSIVSGENVEVILKIETPLRETINDGSMMNMEPVHEMKTMTIVLKMKNLKLIKKNPRMALLGTLYRGKKK